MDDNPELQIECFDNIGGSNCIGYAIQAQAEMIQDGYASRDSVLVFWDSKAVVCTDMHKDIVGIILYTKSDWQRTCFITVGYVSPDHRGRGVYTKMWNALVEKAKEEKIRTIQGVTKANNQRMREVARALGRVEDSINLIYTVE